MVIFIISLILYVMVFNIHPILKDVQEKQDINVITSSFLILQNISIINKKASTIHLSSNYIECYLDDRLIMKKEINEEVSSNFPNDTIKINEDGNIYRGGTITLEDSDITFFLGSGSYEVK